MSIKRKLFFSFGLVLLIAVGAFSTVYLSLQAVGHSYNQLVDVEVRKLNLAQEIQYQDLLLTDSVKGLIINPDSQKDLDTYNREAAEIESNIVQVRKLVSDARITELFKELDQHNQNLIDLESRIIALSGENRQSAIELYNGEYTEIRNIFSDNLEEFKNIQTNIIAEKASEDKQMLENRSLYGLIAIGLSLAVGLVIAFLISRNITLPLQKVAAKLDELSENEGDLTARLDVKGKDETGMLAASFNKMLENIQAIIKQVQVNAVELASASEQLSASSEQNAHAVNQVTSTIQEIAAGSDKQEQGTEESSEAVQKIASDIQRITDYSAAMAESSAHTNQTAAEGNQSILKSIEQMNRIQQSVAAAGGKVNYLGTLSNKIDRILEVITGIADQTNLLALNAAIEAARAGEHGKSFSVVAAEVRKLAEESKGSASEITKLIKEIQINTSEAMIYMNQGTGEVEAGIAVVNQAGQSFSTILTSVQQVSAQMQESAAACQQVSAGTNQVAVSIAELSEIAREAASGSQNAAAASEEQLASIEEVSSSAANLSVLAERLQLLAGKFNA